MAVTHQNRSFTKDFRLLLSMFDCNPLENVDSARVSYSPIFWESVNVSLLNMVSLYTYEVNENSFKKSAYNVIFLKKIIIRKNYLL